MTAPTGWQTTTLGALGRYLNGRAFKKDEWTLQGRPIIRIQNLTGSSSAFNYFEGEVADRYVVRQGDLLVSWAATLGAYFWHGEEGVLNQHIFKVESNIDPRFHKYLLDHKLAELMKHTHGSGMVHITRGRFDSLQVSVPPIAEQRRIVAVLDDYLSRLDAAARTASDAARRLEALNSVTLRRAFETTTGARRALLDVAAIANGQTPKDLVAALVTERGAGSVPFFKVGDMNAADGRWMDGARFFVPDGVSRELGLHVRPPGTVLIPKRGGAIATNKKRILREAACYDLNTMGLVPGPDLDSSYLWHWLQTVDLGRVADGSNVPQINAAQIRDMALPVPDLAVQRSICAQLDAIREQIHRLSRQIAATDKRSLGLRSAVLAAAFRGELTPTEEPISV